MTASDGDIGFTFSEMFSFSLHVQIHRSAVWAPPPESCRRAGRPVAGAVTVIWRAYWEKQLTTEGINGSPRHKI